MHTLSDIPKEIITIVGAEIIDALSQLNGYYKPTIQDLLDTKQYLKEQLHHYEIEFGKIYR